MADFSKVDVNVNLSGGTAMVTFRPNPVGEFWKEPYITVYQVPVPSADGTTEAQLRDAAVAAARDILKSA